MERKSFRKLRQPNTPDQTPREKAELKLHLAAVHSNMIGKDVQLIAIEGVEFYVLDASCNEIPGNGGIFAVRAGTARVALYAQYGHGPRNVMMLNADHALGVTLRELMKRR